MSLTDREQLAIDQARVLLRESGVWDLEDDLSCLIDRYIERANKNRALDEFMLAVKERCNRIPLGHIVGTVEFDSMPLVVGSGVFIPRHHSKVIHKWLEASPVLKSGTIVLDLCAGSGAIGLAIARRRPDLKVTCVEVDEIAIQYLKRNVDRLANLGIQANHMQADILNTRAFTQFKNQVGLIVANPPYVPQFQELLPEWSNHHPKASVYSGTDGLELIRQIILLASELLSLEGWLAIEHGEEQAIAVRDLFEQRGFTNTQTIIDKETSDASGSSVMTTGCKSY
ncbi:HemK/PrmC family methyltransferase [Pseudomonas sp. 10S4]|uniref:HemK/PrmC family methyltransferase n=1 Tax=Pseudomonas sp. 10S4 TaxID=3048583 RepID=UPI002AC90516|nr:MULTISPECIES: HemK/PrmC family methyltransferase [unclassified Pseudomonas]MEB0223907.1 HemK/PrmC family methyltransferase [Pseudomonas sp. 5S1]MEB0295506.1 HemK/PrmC family methyltransferase [Pseudomonas sp. 10S4]WPX21324.1 HemK/PrmC family methyltransferase [Pseudomonas sp. 10S4]